MKKICDTNHACKQAPSSYYSLSFAAIRLLSIYLILTVQNGFLYLIRYIIKAVELIKNIFMNVLYSDTKYINRSRYLTQNTIK